MNKLQTIWINHWGLILGLTAILAIVIYGESHR